MPPDPERGWFRVWCNGEVVAGATGPYEAIKREAEHYAAVYGHNFSVRVRVARIGKRKERGDE